MRVFDEKLGTCDGSGAAEECKLHQAARNTITATSAISRWILNGHNVVEQVVDIVRLKLERRHVGVSDGYSLGKGFFKATDRILKGDAAERQRVRVRALVRSADRVAARTKEGGDFLPW